MRKRTATFFVLVLAWQFALPGRTIDAKAKRLATALAKLQQTPDDPALQTAYLKAFPHTYKEFLSLFDYSRPLDDGHDYIDELLSLAKNHEMEVGRSLVLVAKDAHREADASSYLQQATARYGSEHTAAFASLLKQLPPDETSSLITFLADMENYSAYQEYDQLTKRLRALNESARASQFEAARDQHQRRHSQ